MKSKPIKIDWEGLEDAFNEQRSGLVSYLDLVTGQVVLEGEGETEDDRDDPEDYGDEAVAKVAVPTAKDGTRLYITPPPTERKLEWFRDFLDEADFPDEVLDEFEEAFDAADPAAALRDALNRRPEVRDAWYRYRTEQIQAMIDEWIAGNGVQYVDPPPWR